MRIAVLGATGVIGRHVVPRLREHGHEVRAQSRGEADAEALRRVGIETVQGDIFDLESLRQAVTGCSAALHLATAVPRPGQAPSWARNDRIRREGTANLLEACGDAGVQRYVQQSIAFLVGGTSDLIDETAPLLPGRQATASATDMERLVAASGLDWVILRRALWTRNRAGRALAGSRPCGRASASQGRLGLYLADPRCRSGGVLRARDRTGSLGLDPRCGRRPADDLPGALQPFCAAGRRRGPGRRRCRQLSFFPHLGR